MEHAPSYPEEISPEVSEAPEVEPVQKKVAKQFPDLTTEQNLLLSRFEVDEQNLPTSPESRPTVGLYGLTVGRQTFPYSAEQRVDNLDSTLRLVAGEVAEPEEIFDRLSAYNQAWQAQFADLAASDYRPAVEAKYQRQKDVVKKKYTSPFLGRTVVAFRNETIRSVYPGIDQLQIDIIGRALDHYRAALKESQRPSRQGQDLSPRDKWVTENERNALRELQLVLEDAGLPFRQEIIASDYREAQRIAKKEHAIESGLITEEGYDNYLSFRKRYNSAVDRLYRLLPKVKDTTLRAVKIEEGDKTEDDNGENVKFISEELEAHAEYTNLVKKYYSAVRFACGKKWHKEHPESPYWPDIKEQIFEAPQNSIAAKTPNLKEARQELQDYLMRRLAEAEAKAKEAVQADGVGQDGIETEQEQKEATKDRKPKMDPVQEIKRLERLLTRQFLRDGPDYVAATYYFGRPTANVALKIRGIQEEIDRTMARNLPQESLELARQSMPEFGRQLGQKLFGQDVSEVFFLPIGGVIRTVDDKTKFFTLSVFDERYRAALGEKDWERWQKTWQSFDTSRLEDEVRKTVLSSVDGLTRDPAVEKMHAPYEDKLQKMKTEYGFTTPPMFSEKTGRLNRSLDSSDVEVLAEILPDFGSYIDSVEPTRTIATSAIDAFSSVLKDYLSDASGNTRAPVSLFDDGTFMLGNYQATLKTISPEEAKNRLALNISADRYDHLSKAEAVAFRKLLGSKLNVSELAFYRACRVRISNPIRRAEAVGRTYFLRYFSQYLSGSLEDEPIKSFFDGLTKSSKG